FNPAAGRRGAFQPYAGPSIEDQHYDPTTGRYLSDVELMKARGILTGAMLSRGETQSVNPEAPGYKAPPPPEGTPPELQTRAGGLVPKAGARPVAAAEAARLNRDYGPGSFVEVNGKWYNVNDLETERLAIVPEGTKPGSYYGTLPLAPGANTFITPI